MSLIGETTLEKLTPLLGVWQGRGHGEYHTIADFDYTETIRFRNEPGAAYLTYEQSTELVDAEGELIRRSHWEAGVLRPLEDGGIELACVQSGGRVEVLRAIFWLGKLILQSCPCASKAPWLAMMAG